MESMAITVSLDKIDQKLIYNTETKIEKNFQDIWKELKTDQLVYVNFFRRWGCLFCKAGALELNKIFEKIDLVFPGKIKIIGIGIEEIGYEEFKKNGYFKHDLYINRNKTIYRALDFQKIGCCFGICKSDYWKRKKDVTSKYNVQNDFSLRQDNFQMGGALIINANGEIIWQYMDRFLGDYAKESDIIEIITEYYKKNDILMK